ncbi:FtsX-like permease family protein [Saccharomonospora piscinae]|uniref:FtsX-like permease family protein n=1 Tax=Saccharomonospora piscinae TaxID=687388 RepID=UPI000465B74F|nr:FtsX-like permease family protein [Saccharomonospora piscinae]
MLMLAGRTLRDRRSVFVGSFVALVLGSAMLMAAISVITSAASADVTGQDRETLDGVSSMIGFLAALAAFLSIFIVASTFAFAVAARARELALLRMIGATPKQMRRLVRAEALLVGVVGSALGCLLGLLVGAALAQLLVLVGVAPDGFALSLSGPTWYVALPVSAVTGLLVTWFGAGAAARRASRASPSDALREADVDERVMTGRRWIMGLVFLAIGIGGVAILPALAGDVQIPIAVFLAEPFVIAAVLLAPLFLGGLSSWIARDRSATGMLAAATLRTGVRRTTSTSAPIVLAMGVCGSLLGVSVVMSAASEASLRERYTSDVVVTGNIDGAADAIRAEPGVDGVTTIGHARVRTVEAGGLWDQPVNATVVDPGTVSAGIRLDEVSGSLDRLRGPSVLMGENLAWSLGWEQGGEYSIRLPDGSSHRVEVVGLYRDDALVQSMLVPDDLVRAGEGTTAVHVSVESEPSPVRDAVAATLPGSSVELTGDWLAPLIEEQNAGMRSGVWLLSGFALVYALLAIANTTAMAFRSRRHEFDSLRLVGTTDEQLRGLVRREAGSIGLAGALVGSVIAFGTTVAVWFALRTSVAETPFALPVVEVVVLAACCVGMVVAVSVATVRSF